ncbi:MAG: alpha-2-macroglobulin [Gammaproteobacteria bacterium]
MRDATASALATRRPRRSQWTRAARGSAILLLAGFWAAVVAAAEIQAVSPQGSVRDVRQVVLTFDSPMVAFGDPRLPAPATVDCAVAGRGRWADARHWVHDFAHDLPAGLACSITLADDLRALDGSPLAGPRAYTFDTGGPAIRASKPYDGHGSIDAEQVFLLALDAAAEPQSVVANAACIVAGINERIPVVLLDDAERAAVFAARGELGYDYYNLLRQLAGDGATAPTPADLAAAETRVLALRCQRRLPPDTDLRLSWGAGIRAPSGVATAADQALAFHTRASFTVRVECTRVNARAPCLPLEPVRVVFSAPIARDLAAAVTVVDGDGRVYTPGDEGADAATPTVEALEYPGPFPAHGKLTVSLPAGLVDDAGRAAENAARYPLALALDGYPPLVKFDANFGIVEARGGAVLPVTVRKVEAPLAARGLPVRALALQSDADIARWLRRVDEAMARRGEWVPGKDERDEGHWRELTGSTSVFGDDDATQAFTVPTPAGDQAFQVVGIPLEGPGLHVVEIASPVLGAALLGRDAPRYVATAALVTDLAVHFKWGRDRSLAWVTALESGEPVAGAHVAISRYCTGAVLFEGESGADGTLVIDADLGLPHGQDYCSEYSDGPLMVSARVEGDVGFVLTAWNDGISPDHFKLRRDYGPRGVLAHTVFDRALFRAGETVSMKHFLRAPGMQGFDVPAAAARVTRLRIVHAGSNEQVELPLDLGADGVGESRWAIPDSARLGEYRVLLAGDDAMAGPWESGRFRVEAFRVPTMKAVVQAPAAPQVAPSAVALDLHLAYRAGGAASNAAVKLRSVVEDREVSFDDYPEFRFGGEDVMPGVMREDATGDDGYTALWRRYGDHGGGAVPALPARVMPLSLDEAGSARVQVDELPTVERPQRLLAELEYQDANGERFTASTRVPLWPAALVVGVSVDGWAGTREALELEVLALDLEGRPLTGRAVEVSLFKRDWYGYRKRLLGGFYTYESESRVTPLAARCGGVSDAYGRVHCTLAPDASGNVLVRASARDDAGREAVTTTSAWVAGDDDWWFDPGAGDRMDVLPERKAYAPGEIARLQVRMPFRAATALVTVEREGVIEAFVTHLEGDLPVVEVPLVGHYAPDVYVSVLAVRGRVGWWQSLAAEAARELELDWRVEGGFPTAQVDLAKPAWRLGMAQLKVGWDAHRLAVDVKPRGSVFRVRETVPVEVSVKRVDGGALPDAAEIAFVAVDEGLLELGPNDSWNLLEAMMGERGLNVLTSTAQMQVIGKRHYGRKAVPHGGGGGRGAVRERFDTLLVWRGRVALDGAGRATVELPLNDALTGFRLVAIAHAGSGFFGTGAASIRTTQDLMLHAGLPPLVREGDRFRAGFTVRNASTRNLAGTVEARWRAATGDAETLPAQAFDLAPGRAIELGWAVEVPLDAGRLDWELTAAAGDLRDALKVEQAVVPAWPVRTWAQTLARLDTPLRLPAAPPAGAVAGRGGLVVHLNASLAGGLDGVREYMARYPYVCLEQQVSRAIVAGDEAEWNALATRLPRYLDGDGLLRFYPAAWLPGSDVLTAYVLGVAAEAGWTVPADTLARLRDGLSAFASGRLQRDSATGAMDLAIRRLAAVAALARHGAAEAAMLETIAIDPALWPTSAVLDWLDVLARVDGIADATRLRAQAFAVLRARLDFQGTVMGFATAATDAAWWLLASGDVNAVRAVLAVVDEPAWQADVPRMLRGALARQRAGHWDTTVANAWGALAARRFGARFEATPISGTTRLTRGAQQRELDWPGDAAAAAQTLPAIELPWGNDDAALELSHDGGGAPWALVASRAALPLTAPVSSGYTITRTVTAVEQAVAGEWRRGDIARVTLDIAAQSDMGWVVVDDPVPAGATILGSGLGGDSAIATRGEQRSGMVEPAYEERRADAFRAYYAFVPKGRWTVEYTVRLDNPGTFVLPATRVEAMYAPEMFGELPNAPLTVTTP